MKSPVYREERAYLPSDFRREHGNHACANGFTFSWGDRTGVTHELGLTSGDGVRVRAVFNYQALNDDTSTPNLELNKVSVIRERLDDWPSGEEKGFAGSPGIGLYERNTLEDRQNPNMDLALNGGQLTISMPKTLTPDTSKAWYIDWTPSAYRYQLDRTFISGDYKQLHSLELTEIQAED